MVKISCLIIKKISCFCLHINSIRRITTKGFAKIININEIIAVSDSNGKIFIVKFEAGLDK
jgi:hypothetical protein